MHRRTFDSLQAGLFLAFYIDGTVFEIHQNTQNTIFKHCDFTFEEKTK